MLIATQKLKKLSTQPEDLFYTGHMQDSEVHITLINYDENACQKTRLEDISHLAPITGLSGVKWLNVDGIHDVDIIESVGLQFGLHFLIMEDIVDVNQRPKYEDYDNFVYISMKELYLDQVEERIVSEHISFILLKDTLLTFQERQGDMFDAIRNRIMNNKGKIRKLGADYLLYSLIDALVDHYFVILEDIGEEVSALEKDVITRPRSDLLNSIYNLKTDIIFLRKAAVPLREVIMKLQKEESDLINDYLDPYARDLLDHVVQVIETLRTYGDTIEGILVIYTSSVNNATNEIMRRLTLITTIFMPLTFLSGIGGMSEWSMMTGSHNWPLTYPLFVLGCVVIGVVTYIILRVMQNRKTNIY